MAAISAVSTSVSAATAIGGSRGARCVIRATPIAATRTRRSVRAFAVVNVTEDNFQAEVVEASSSQPVLLDFWANWCGPCKLVSPFMDWADETYGNLKVVKIETDPNPKLVEELKVYGLPTLMLFKDGRVVEGSKHEGAITKKGLGEWLAKYGINP